MNRLLLSLVLMFSFFYVMAQVPEGINYQAVVRDDKGEVMVNKTVEISASFYDETGGSSGMGNLLGATSPVTITTSQFGLVNMVLDVSAIPNIHLAKSIDINEDVEGLIGSSDLQSVPFALKSAIADSVIGIDSDAQWIASGNDVYYDAGSVGIGASAISSFGLYVSVPSVNNTRPYACYISQQYSGGNIHYGARVDVSDDGTGTKHGVYSRVVGNSVSNSDVYGLYSFVNHQGLGNEYGLYVSSSGTGTGEKFGVYIDGEEKNYFSGNVGVGTKSPTSNLHISSGDVGDAWLYIESDEANTSGIGEDYNPGIAFLQDGGIKESAVFMNSNQLILANSINSGGISFRTNTVNSFENAIERMFIAGNGNVGVGTNTPEHEFHIKGDGQLVDLEGIDHAYIGYYPLGMAAGRKAYVGFGSPNGKNFTINNEYTGGNLLLQYSEGNVGIGTINPTKAKLEVEGYIGRVVSEYGYLNRTSPTGKTTDNSINNYYSIYASDRIGAQEFNAFSDVRIKNIEGLSDSRDDLHKLLGVEITDYTLTDTISKGRKKYKKVIAQQVKKVYPQAVSDDVVEVVPDIYKRADVKDGWVCLATDLKVEEKVQLIFRDTKKVFVIEETKEGAFRVKGGVDVEEVFVYGREVDDFHTVDYEAISMLNVSATQELYKQIQQLEKDKVGQKAQIEKQASELELLKAQFEEMKRFTGFDAEANMGR